MSSMTDVGDRECQQLQAAQTNPSMPPHPLSESSRIDAVVGDSNPFETDGLLSRKADYILSHSTIKRNELRISDPDLATKPQTVECVRSEAVYSVEQAPANGQLPESHSGGVVEAEVGQIVVSVPDQQQAEQVKLVSNKCKCKCCSVQ